MSVVVELVVAATESAVEAQEPTSPPIAINADPSKVPKILSGRLSGGTGPTLEHAGAEE